MLLLHFWKEDDESGIRIGTYANSVKRTTTRVNKIAQSRYLASFRVHLVSSNILGLIKAIGSFLSCLALFCRAWSFSAVGT